MAQKQKTVGFTKEKSRFFFVLNRTASHVVYHRFLSPEIKWHDAKKQKQGGFTWLLPSQQTFHP